MDEMEGQKKKGAEDKENNAFSSFHLRTLIFGLQVVENILHVSTDVRTLYNVMVRKHIFIFYSAHVLTQKKPTHGKFEKCPFLQQNDLTFPQLN